MVLNKLITSFNNLFGISHWEENKKENDSGSPSFLGEEYSTSDMPILSFDEKESEEEKPKKQFGVSRPQKWDDFIGESNKSLVERIKISCQASQKTGEPLEHLLFFGSGGLGKTTLSKIIANETKCALYEITGSTINKQLDIYNIMLDIVLLQLQGKKVILFIDEVHDIAGKDSPVTLWYPIFEHYTFHHNLKGTVLRRDNEVFNIVDTYISINPFTIIGATTDPGMLPAPLRDRFTLSGILKSYTVNDLSAILKSYSARTGLIVTDEAALELSKRARGIPRIAINLLLACKNRAIVFDSAEITTDTTRTELRAQSIDIEGLNDLDYLVLDVLSRSKKGLGIANLAGSCCLNKTTILELVEPFLKQKGYMEVTTRRCITDNGLKVLNSRKERYGV